jgi:hypothetical protein
MQRTAGRAALRIKAAVVNLYFVPVLDGGLRIIFKPRATQEHPGIVMDAGEPPFDLEQKIVERLHGIPE